MEEMNAVANTAAFNGIPLLNIEPSKTITRTETITKTETIMESNPTTIKIVNVKPGTENRVIAGYINVPNRPSLSYV